MNWAGQSLLDFDRFMRPVLAGRVVGKGAPCIHVGWVSEACSECTEGAPTPHHGPAHLSPPGSFPHTEGFHLNLPNPIHILILTHKQTRLGHPMGSGMCTPLPHPPTAWTALRRTDGENL